MTLTLLERWDDSHTEAMRWKPDEIRRAIAIAQAFDERCDEEGIGHELRMVLRRADKLLEGK